MSVSPAHVRFLESLERVDRAIRKAETLEQMLEGVLDEALGIFGSDRAWLLYPCDPDTPTYRVPMERTRPEYPGALQMGIDVPTLPATRELFLALCDAPGPVAFDENHVSRVLPPDLAVRFGIRSQIVQAVHPKRGKAWLFGLHQCSHARVWTREDEELFTEVGRRMADGLGSLLLLRDLQESEEKLRSTLESMDDAVFVLDRDGVFRDYFQPGGEDDLHGERDALLGRSFREALPADVAGRFEEAIRALDVAGGVQQVEYALTRLGRTRWYSAKLSPQRDASGQLTAVTVVARDVTGPRRIQSERDALLEREHEARVDAERSVRMRDDFLAMASHELQTPLTPLSMRLQVVRRRLRALSSDVFPGIRSVLESMDATEHELDRLRRLIADLLDVSRITANRLVLHRTRTDLSRLLADVVARFGAELERVGSSLTVDAEPGVTGDWDSARLDQVVSNLLSNAIKYGDGKPIEVHLSRRGPNARLRVRDHGIGIAEPDQARLFQRFERMAPIRRYSGLGLGLYITRQIVEAHGGTIEAQSAPGEGATFTVEVPCEVEGRPAAP